MKKKQRLGHQHALWIELMWEEIASVQGAWCAGATPEEA